MASPVAVPPSAASASIDSRTAPRAQPRALDPRDAVVEGHAADLDLARHVVQEALGRAAHGGDAAGPDVGGAHGRRAVGGQHHRGAAVGHRHRALGPGEGQRQRDQGQRVDHHRRVPAPAGAAAHHGGHRGRRGERGGGLAPAAVQQQVGRRPPRGTATSASRNQGAPKLTGRRAAARAAWSGARGPCAGHPRAGRSRARSRRACSRETADDTSAGRAHRAAVDAHDHVAGRRSGRPGRRGRPWSRRARARRRAGRRSWSGR